MPSEIETIVSESQPEIDTTAALADISSELFGQGSSEGADQEKTPVVETPAGEQAEKTPGETKSPVEKSPPAQDEAKTEETSAEVQAIGAPSTWTKEALAEWASIPPRAQQEILKREEDALRGITQYKGRAEIGDKYEAVVNPYRPVLEAAQIDPVQLFQSFAANHYLLSRGSEDQKLELAANMIQGYGIDFTKLINFVGNRIIEPVDPKISELEARLAKFESAETQRTQAEAESAQTALLNEVDTFVKDPAYPYAAELLDDMAAIFGSKQASTLQEAYEKAVYLNPTTRAKEIARLTAANGANPSPAPQAERDDKGRFVAADVKLDPKARDGTVAVGSIDDTLNETMARIQARG
jgi:hypothetical protein